LILFIILFVVPQTEIFQQGLRPFFIDYEWKNDSDAVVWFKHFHLVGKMWKYRVNDTLGITGILPIFIAPLLFFLMASGNKDHRNSVIVIGLLPFCIYFIPFFHYIWLSNADISLYYRICYTSFFWIHFVYLFHILDLFISKNDTKKRKPFFAGIDVGQIFYKNRLFYFCVIFILLLSSIRSGPVYGKLDFIILDNRPWLEAWRPLIKNSINNNKVKLFSDPQTNQVVKCVFNLPIQGKTYEHIRHSIIDIEHIDDVAKQDDIKCVINMRGYKSSWVPEETGHWQQDLGNTSLYYKYKGLTGEKLKKYLKENPLDNCEVFF
jgi:hypothetical protein